MNIDSLATRLRALSAGARREDLVTTARTRTTDLEVQLKAITSELAAAQQRRGTRRTASKRCS